MAKNGRIFLKRISCTEYRLSQKQDALYLLQQESLGVQLIMWHILKKCSLNGSIHITEANWPGEGEYNDRIISQSFREIATNVDLQIFPESKISNYKNHPV